jgi:hypothetical protein
MKLYDTGRFYFILVQVFKLCPCSMCSCSSGPVLRCLASTSRKQTPASAFRHSSPKSGTESKKKCPTVLPVSGTGLIPALLVFPFQCWTHRMPECPAFWQQIKFHTAYHPVKATHEYISMATQPRTAFIFY